MIINILEVYNKRCELSYYNLSPKVCSKEEASIIGHKRT